jgi:hypothetical protein
MRHGIAVLSAVLLVPASTANAENAAVVEGAPPIGLERPWLRPMHDDRLARAAESPPVEDVENRIAELEARRAGINRRWPTAGLIVGGVTTAAGVLTLVLNEFCGFGGDWFSDDPDHNDHSDCTNGWIAGGIVTGAGVALLGISGGILAQRNRERRAIDREIKGLRTSATARRATTFGFGLDLGERKGVRLSWRY